jgi:arylsulfatase A-like enzyme
MGGLRNKLRRFDESRRTIVFIMSDNGYMWADHGLYDKGAPYTPSTRIPMLMRYPAGPKLERRDRRLVGNIDVAPTVLDLAGISPDPLHPMDGTSLVSPDWSRDRILSEYRNSGNLWTPPTWASTHRKRVQYIEYFDSEGNRIFRELYRLKSDPWQLTNVLADGRDGNDPSPARLQALSATLQADRNCSGPSCP